MTTTTNNNIRAEYMEFLAGLPLERQEVHLQAWLTWLGYRLSQRKGAPAPVSDAPEVKRLSDGQFEVTA